MDFTPARLVTLTAGIALAGFLALAALPADAASVDAQFRAWLANDLWPEARRRGISRTAFDAAFKGVKPNLKLPDLILPGRKDKVPKKQRQAEFRSPAAYFAPNTIGAVISGGRDRLKRLAKTLQTIERKTGVPPQIIVAVWGRESAFGNAKIPYNAFEVLGTKAFLSIRKELFRKEVLAALEMVETRGVRISAMRGSWAGALGQPQFMPSSYLRYARDFDGDNKADIWNSVPDSLGSIGAYLAEKGWVKGRDWGFEVTLPADISCHLEGPDQGRPIADWAAMGIRRVSGKPFPAHELRGEGYLTLPAGRHGPAFITTPNFFVLKEYNNSDLYALFVGHAGDRMRYGGKPFVGKWSTSSDMLRSDIASIQSKLEGFGYDVGGADGLPGFKTRRSIGHWQAKNGLKPTCFPGPELIRRLK